MIKSYLNTTADNGNSWEDITFNLNVTFVTKLYVYNGKLFVGTAGGGVYRSTNFGNSFQAANNGFGATAYMGPLLLRVIYCIQDLPVMAVR